MPGEPGLPPACLPHEEPLADLDAFERAARAFITAHHNDQRRCLQHDDSSPADARSDTNQPAPATTPSSELTSSTPTANTKRRDIQPSNTQATRLDSQAATHARDPPKVWLAP